MAVFLVGLALAYSACGHTVNAWTTPFADSHARKWVLSQRQHRAEHLRPFHERGLLHKLFGGTGTANNYSWKEEQFEIEVTIMVPPDTNAKDVKFKCSSNGIDLRLAGKEGAVEERILLDGKRTMRGKICVDGTFWSISDSDLSSLPKQYDASMPDSTKSQRQINIVIKKHFVPTSSVGGTLTYDQLTDFDWGGLYPDDEAEVSFRKYGLSHQSMTHPAFGREQDEKNRMRRTGGEEHSRTRTIDTICDGLRLRCPDELILLSYNRTIQ